MSTEMSTERRAIQRKIPSLLLCTRPVDTPYLGKPMPPICRGSYNRAGEAQFHSTRTCPHVVCWPVGCPALSITPIMTG